MEIIYEIPKRVIFEEIDIGVCFESIKGIALMRIKSCYEESNLNNIQNAVELETGELKYFYPADTVVPLKIVGTIKQEVITCPR